jgi:hypothetical protein
MFIQSRWAQVYFRRKYIEDTAFFEIVKHQHSNGWHEWSLLIGPLRMELAVIQKGSKNVTEREHQ